MRRGLLLLPTLMVLVAVPILFGFGVWQLQRMQWKEALLAELARNADMPPVTLGTGQIPADYQFRTVRIQLDCPAQTPVGKAGRSLSGATGYSQILTCEASGEAIHLNAGWGPRGDSWAGMQLPQTGEVEGVLVESKESPVRWVLVARKAFAPLEPSAPPSTDTISNSHFSYAMQWFGFAIILSAIYALFVRRWRAAPVAPAAGEG